MQLPKLALASAVLSSVILPPQLTAQRGRQRSGVLWERLDAKLAEDWVGNALWITDFAKAKEMAARSGKHIFAYFTRSYAP